MHNVVDLTQALCSIPSITKNEEKVVEFVADVLKKEGYTVEFQELPEGSRANIFAYLNGSKPRVLFTTHLDTVPPYFPPRLSDDAKWLTGRGTCDAKGIAAAMLCAAFALKESGDHDHALLFVVGEETISDGAKLAAKSLNRTFDYVIHGEPTEMKLASSMKGALVFQMSAQGKTGHSAYPQSGHSALHQLIEDAARILNHPWPSSDDFGETTVNIGVMKGGQAPNVLASDAELNGVARLTFDVEQAKQVFKKLINPKTNVNFLSTSSPRKLHTVEGFETCHVAFGCDIPHMENLGTPLLFGPGSILDAHTAHERVRIADLHNAVQCYQKLFKLLTGSVLEMHLMADG